MPEQLIRIFTKDPDSSLYDHREDFLASEFYGVVPRVGEFIFSKWQRKKPEDGREWSDKTVYVVEAVYYRPGKRVVLVVRDRQMADEEWMLH